VHNNLMLHNYNVTLKTLKHSSNTTANTVYLAMTMYLLNIYVSAFTTKNFTKPDPKYLFDIILHDIKHLKSYTVHCKEMKNHEKVMVHNLSHNLV